MVQAATGPTARPAATPKLAMVVAARLREQIVRGELPPGSSLPIERDLIESSNASRFTVREALRLLEAEGLIEIRRGVGGGPRVRQPSISATAQTMGVLLQLLDVPVMDAWAARSSLVQAAVTDLAASRGDEDVVALEASWSALAGFADEVEFYERWIDFTELLVGLAGNRTRSVLVRTLHSITAAQLDAATRAAAPDQADRVRAYVVDSCRRILDHVAARDVAGARDALAEQTALQTNGMANFFGPLTVVDVLPSSGPPGPPAA
ncbi:MAG: FadR/GntR family transcriptional regulator, partial [Acidimicrobiia bacterium]